MKCLVTGASGFIGNSLVRRLIEEDHQVVALLHKSKPKNLEKKAEYVYGDITDVNSVRSFFRDVDYVFHCAALVKDYGPKKIFYKTNFEGTKNIAYLSQENKIKKFIFLSHIRYESEKSSGAYYETKLLAERHLLEKYESAKFPVIIIRPGNVYGPGATTWVLRPLSSIKKNRIALVDRGNGIFLHTYIDNLLDAIILALDKLEALGKVIDVTDGDNNTSWKTYFNMLADMAGKPEIKRNMSRNGAIFIGKIMVILNKIIRIDPWVTPMAVNVLTNKNTVSIETARKLLNYEPEIDFTTGMKKVEEWLKNESYIN
jgi:nucleoside-diphosphate-sugar epimerase